MTPHLIRLSGQPGEFHSYIRKQGILIDSEHFQFGDGFAYVFYVKMDRQQAVALKLTIPDVRCMELPGN